jgi:hypothetical protein
MFRTRRTRSIRIGPAASAAVAWAAAVLLPISPAQALHFPDTTSLVKTWKIAERKDGKPVGFYRKAQGDSLAMRLEWGPHGLVSIRLDQPDEIPSDSFAALTQEYGNGAAWHETAGGLDSQVVKLYPGVQQEWVLKGFGGEQGWLGSGVERGRFFLVFRGEPPIARVPVLGPLRFSPALYAYLDTSSEWIHVPCKDMPGAETGVPAKAKAPAKGAPDKGNGPGAKPPAKSVCFSPDDDSHWLIRIDSRKPLAVQAWLEEQGSPALAEIKRAIGKIPDASQVEYAKDLSQMLLGEGQMFLVKLAQRLPIAFNWPSWQIQDFKSGQVSYTEFLPWVRRQAEPGEFLPAFRSRDPALRLSVDLYYRGTVHLSAESEP